MNTDISQDDCRVAEFDPVEYLQTPEDCVLLLNEALASGDARSVARCLGIVVKALDGMGCIARKAGLNRPCLYESLSGKIAPRTDTLLSVMNALGMELHATLKTP